MALLLTYRVLYKSLLLRLWHGVALILCLFSHPLLAQKNPGIARLKAMSIEELMTVEVTSVSRGPERLSQAASAIQVITREAIQRSGAASIPEALRLATNLQVAQLNSSAWIISARGFNTVFANKLLVLIDGRTVYTPLFGGVLWDLQHVLLEDVEQIEVISGPGGTMWGANAVNGVINIITKKARDTEGLYLSAAAAPLPHSDDLDPEQRPFATPNFLKHAFAARYGAKINEKTFFRVYGQHGYRNSTLLNDTARNNDDWGVTQAGFRVGLYPNEKDFITVQGDVYKGLKDRGGNEASFDGQNILTRWSRTVNEKSQYILQLYYDRYFRNDPGVLADELKTYDVDFQHRYKITTNSELLWGVGYRHVEDHVINRANIGILPRYRTMPLYTAFLQNETGLTSFLKLTIGSKLQHNFFSGLEFQPSVRLAASLNEKNTVWTAVSKAVRTPSRMDVDYYLFLPPDPVIVRGNVDTFVSERLRAYELGYRVQPTSTLSLTLAGFYNEYRDVYSVEPMGDGTYQIMNGSEAETWGGEFSGIYQAAKSWRVRGGFTYFDKSIRPKPGRNHDPSYLMNDVKHQALLQSMLDITDDLEVDLIARYVDFIPASFATVAVRDYITFDARIAYRLNFLELAIIGQNLWSERHSEFGAGMIPRSLYVKATCRF